MAFYSATGAPPGLPRAGPWLYLPAMPFTFAPDPDALSDYEREQARWSPERETLELAASGAARVLGPDHRVTKAFAKAAVSMGKVDLWRARLAMKTLRKDQREAIAAAAES